MTMLHDQASSLNHGSIEGARVFAGLQLLAGASHDVHSGHDDHSSEMEVATSKARRPKHTNHVHRDRNQGRLRLKGGSVEGDREM